MQSTSSQALGIVPLDSGQSSHSPEAGSPVDVGNEFAALVAQIQSNDERGIEALHSKFGRGLRYYFCRQIGACDHEDRLHDVWLIVIRAIRRGDLREPERLPGFIRTVAHRKVANHIDEQVTRRKQEGRFEAALEIREPGLNPEQQTILREHAEIASEALKALGERDREILVRFYLHEQSPRQICREMSLSDTQFRLVKSRAKAKFGAIGRNRLRAAA
jgi:RNA polymerase sigma factor (sigma-70 family)